MKKKECCYWLFSHFKCKHIDVRMSGNVSYNSSIDFTQLPMTHFGDSSWLQWLLQSPAHLRFIYPIGYMFVDKWVFAGLFEGSCSCSVLSNKWRRKLERLFKLALVQIVFDPNIETTLHEVIKIYVKSV